MGSENHDLGADAARRLSRRRFFSFAGAAAAAGGAGLAGWRPWAGSGGRAGHTISTYPLTDAAGPPQGVRLGVQRVIWSVDTDSSAFALTFDDGPHEDLTPAVLNILDRYDVKATFFVIGVYVSQRPALLREVVARGHELGNHTWSHVDLTRQDPEEVRRQIEMCQSAVQSATGISPRYFRPPRGLLSGPSTRFSREAETDIALWSVGRGVRGVGTPQAIADHVISAIEPGDIVGLHDGTGREDMRPDLDGPGPIYARREVEVEALPDILEAVLDKGLRPTTVSGLLSVGRSDGVLA